jgi:hypothetical protein
MSIWSLLSLPITVYVANNLFMDLTRYQKKQDDSGKPSEGKDKLNDKAVPEERPVYLSNEGQYR